MLHLDARIEIARADTPREWARYCEIARRVVGDRPDAGREMLRRGTYAAMGWVSGGAEAEEACRLEQIILKAFVDAVQVGRCFVRGVPEGRLTTIDIDPAWITVAAFKHVSKDGQRWTLSGTTFHGVSVVMRPAPKPGHASELRIHTEIRAVCSDCVAKGSKIPNMLEIIGPVQERLRADGLYASEGHIRGLYKDPRYDGLRLKPGRPRGVDK